MNYNRIGKFLSLVLVNTQHLLLKWKDIKDLQVESECGCIHIFPVRAISGISLCIFKPIIDMMPIPVGVVPVLVNEFLTVYILRGF